MPVGGFERGTLRLDVAFSAPASGGLFLCASKAGRAPRLEEQDYHWVSGLCEAAGSCRCRIQTHLWAYQAQEAVVMLALAASAPQLHRDTAVYSGVYFEFGSGGLPDAPAEQVAFRASLEFEPETSLLPAELRAAHGAFYDVFSAIDGMELSSSGKDAMGRAGDLELTYGEVQFVPFWDALRRAVAPQPGESFIDLGSGTGRAVLTAALGFPELRRAIGYEVVPSLHQAAQVAASILRSSCRLASVELYEADFRDVPWEAGIDILWVSSLCMDEETKDAIARRAAKLRPGARIVTMDCFFAEGLPGFERVWIDGEERLSVEMSFGESNVYVLRRTDTEDGGAGEVQLDSLD